MEGEGNQGVARWLHPCSSKTKVEPEKFASIGVDIENVGVYTPRLPEDSRQALLDFENPDAVLFCSGSSVENAFEAAPEKMAQWAKLLPAAALGTSTSQALIAHGWQRYEVAPQANAQGLLQSLQKFF